VPDGWTWDSTLFAGSAGSDLRALLAEVAPDGLFADRLPATEIRIWRRD
jgi:hypothetical protein